MRLLAVDTSTESCSAALLLGERLELRSVLTERNHAELLLPMVDELLAAAHIRLSELDGLAFGRGPGSFTGLRLAAGVVQGFAVATGLRVAAVSSLAAVAWQVAVPAGEAVLVCIDARMGEIYVGCFVRRGDGLEPLVTESVVAPSRAVLLAPQASHAAGNGLLRYPRLASDLRAAGLTVHDHVYPAADAIAGLAVHDFAAGRTVDAADVAPVYVRDDVARPVQTGRGVTTM